MLWLVLLVVLLVSGLGWELKRRQVPPPMDPGLFMRFELTPGERHGVVWHASHASGDAMVATVTTYGFFVLAYATLHAPPVRLSRDGTSITIGDREIITPASAEPMVEMTITSGALPPFTVLMSRRGATAIHAWSVSAR